ncbi:hypothetical protein GE09DRAFT_99998 [Coniochaeta sp. 2T2.1]|nr:hypothetical protein GE09DRAFT_99998 [Coniochaeta sp. 2T2.1]
MLCYIWWLYICTASLLAFREQNGIAVRGYDCQGQQFSSKVKTPMYGMSASAWVRPCSLTARNARAHKASSFSIRNICHQFEHNMKLAKRESSRQVSGRRRFLTYHSWVCVGRTVSPGFPLWYFVYL